VAGTDLFRDISRALIDTLSYYNDDFDLLELTAYININSKCCLFSASAVTNGDRSPVSSQPARVVRTVSLPGHLSVGRFNAFSLPVHSSSFSRIKAALFKFVLTLASH